MPTLIKTVLALLVATLSPMVVMAQDGPSTPTKNEVSTVGIMPHRGMTMEQVKQSFGEPAKIIAPVGKPPISRWVYDGFIVYFEDSYVIHALMTTDNAQ
jgi:hypothetical protein